MKIIRLLPITLFLTYCLLSCSKTYQAWNSVGPIQALGNNNELWIFLEIDRQVAHSGGFGNDHPRVYPVGHFQELVIISKNGLKQRIPIKMQGGKGGHSFHPNLSRIFVMEGDFYMFSGPSAHHKASLYRWQGDHFKLLSVEESESFYKEYKPTYFMRERSESLDTLTESEGWFHLYSDTSFSGAIFQWYASKIDISFSGENEKEFEATIFLTENDTTVPSKLTYDKNQQALDSSGYDSLPREDYGHPK